MRRGKHRKVKARDRLEQLVARPSAWNKPRDSMDWDGWMDGWMDDNAGGGGGWEACRWYGIACLGNPKGGQTARGL